MKFTLLSILLGSLVMTVATNSQAQIGISFGVNTCGYSGLYQSCPYYDPPVGVYLGGGNWGSGREYHGGGHGGGGHERSGGRGRR
jgi:hypothetical protein